MPATDLERLVVQLSADIKKYENALNRAQGQTNRRAQAIESRFSKMNSHISSSFQSALTLTGGLGAALGVAEVVKYADAWTEAGNKVRAAAEIAGVQARSLGELKVGANAARTEFSAYVDLYSKLIRSASNVAKSENEIATATEIVSKSFKAGGAAANEQAAGILQLGQALGSGVLQGDELRSLRENAPILADAIAKEFKTTISGLKDLGAEGKITSDRVFRAILAAQAPIEAAFSKTNSTISDAMTRISNEFTAYIGNADASVGASSKLVESLNYLADNFKEVGDVVLEFVTIIVAALTGRALVGLVAGLGNAVIALGTFITAARAGTLAVASLSAVLGPIGLIAGGAAAAIYLFNGRMNETEAAVSTANTAIRTNETALDAAKSSSEGYTSALRAQIKMQYEAARASFDLAYAELNAARARADNFRAMTKSMTGYEVSFDPFDYAAKTADERATAIGQAALKLGDQLARINKEMENQPSGFGGGSGSGAGKTKKTKANEFERELKQIRERTANLRAETAAQAALNPLINDYGFSVEKARAKQELLNAAQAAGKKVTPELAAEIDSLSTAYATAVTESARLGEKQDEIRQKAEDALATGKDVARGLIDGFVEGADAADILTNSLKKIGDALINNVLDSIFKLNSAGSSGGGFLSGLLGMFGGGGSAFPSAPGGAKTFASPTGGWSFSSGGYTGNGGKYDPAGVVHKGEYVMDAASTKRIGVGNLQAMQAGRMPTLPSIPRKSGGDVSVSVPIQIDATGADAAGLARVERQISALKASLPSTIVKTVKDANGRRTL